MNEKEQANRIAKSIGEMNRYGKFEEAIEQADKAIDQFSPPGFGEGHCFSFDSMEQFLFFCAKLKASGHMDNATWSAGNEAGILTSKAYALCELKRYNEALDTLKLALEYNPVSTSIRFEMIENHFQLHQLEEVTLYLKELATLVIYPTEIARYYRRIGFLFTESAKYEVALASYVFSMYFEDSDLAKNEIGYILHDCMKKNVPEGKAIFCSMKGVDALQILKKNKQLLCIDDERLPLIEDGGNNTEKNYFNAYCALGIVKKPQLCS